MSDFFLFHFFFALQNIACLKHEAKLNTVYLSLRWYIAI